MIQLAGSSTHQHILRPVTGEARVRIFRGCQGKAYL